MPIERMLREVAFDEDAVTVFSTVYDDVVNALCLEGRTHLAPETIARKVIKHARRNQQKPATVREKVLRECRRN